jgi:hypothetical protein
MDLIVSGELLALAVLHVGKRAFGTRELGFELRSSSYWTGLREWLAQLSAGQTPQVKVRGEPQ